MKVNLREQEQLSINNINMLTYESDSLNLFFYMRKKVTKES